MKILEKGRVEYLERAFDQDASAAMKGKVERALVELITNADDSYALLEYRGIRVSGQITMEIERRRKGFSQVIVRDRAEGMNAEEMRIKLCKVGGTTSGFQSGAMVRGLLGRGAKDVAAFGGVMFESIKDDNYAFVKLDCRGHYEVCVPEQATKEIRERLRIPRGSGTVVRIEVEPRFKVPQHETLVGRLPAHYALRDIASDPKRRLVLLNLNEKQHKGDLLIYGYPTGKLVLEDEFEVPGYPGASAKLRVLRVAERFKDDARSPYRQGGILIKSRRAIHEVTLFDFEGDPYAEWFFGKLECPFIDELIREYDRCFEERVDTPSSNPTRLLTRQRDGLVREHPFTRALIEEAQKRLQTLVEEERLRAEEERQRIESVETKKTFQRLAAAASKFIQDKLRDLEIEATGRQGALQLTGEMAVVPPTCTLEPTETKFFSVLAKEELIEKAGAIASIVLAEGEGIELGQTQTTLSPRPDNPKIHSGTFRVTAVQAGAVCQLRTIIGHASCDVYIYVREKPKAEVPVGLSFDHSTYHARFGKMKRLLVRAKVAGEDLEGVTVKVLSDSPDVLPRDSLVVLKKNDELGCYTANVFVSGKKLGGKAKIFAQLRGFIAEATVIVTEREIEGPFNFKIELVPREWGPQRAIWAEQNTVLHISAKHKSIARYLGPEPEFLGQEKPHFKTILAEIVADQVARRIIELREEKQGHDPDFNAPALYLDHQKLLGEFLPIAHEIQLPTIQVRRLLSSE